MTWRHFALVAAAIAPLSVTRRAEAQLPIIVITPSSGSYSAGTKVLVSIDYCSPSGGGGFDGAPGVDFNGLNAGFSYGPRSKSGCDAHGVATGTVTIVQGTNTLYTSVTNMDGGSEATATYQGSAPPPPPNNPPVVTPDAQPYPVPPVTGATFSFTVLNPNNAAVTDTLFFSSCSGVVASSCAIPGPKTLSMGANQTVSVGVTFNVVGAFNQTGTVTLTAKDLGSGQSDNGSLAVLVVPGGPVVSRDLCLTIEVGPSAAYECADLRIVHALPSVRALGKVRTPTLLYNSQLARPRPVVTTTVTLASAADSVVATLNVGGLGAQSRSWPGSQFPSGTQRRVGVVYDPGSSLRTGLHAYTLEVRRYHLDSLTTIATVSDTLAIVSRDSSAFGAGWWLAGLEQLYFPPAGGILWVGGDGSVRCYVSIGSSTYVAAPVDHPDTLLYRTGSNEYVRILPGGDSVVFTSTGLHTRTVNRLGYRTEFEYDGSNRLWKIRVPPQRDSLVYTFSYGGNGRLNQVTAPDTAGASGRVTTVGATGLRLTSIQDPASSAAVVFGYGTGADSLRIAYRTNRRNATTYFGFDSGSRLRESKLGLSSGANDTIRTTFTVIAETRGLSTQDATAQHPDSVFTRLDGPRAGTDSADVHTFWLAPLGGVRQVQDPYGYVTTVTRADIRWPALPTRMQTPSGHIMSASYDARGNLAADVDSNPYSPGQHLTTQYLWDQRWDELTLITLPNGQIKRYNLDASSGNVTYVEDGRGSAARTNFTYVSSGNGAGLLQTVTAPGGATTTLKYDWRGNVDSTVSPLGWTTAMLGDRLGRLRVTKTALGPQPTSEQWRSDTTAYDAMGRVRRSRSYAPAIAPGNYAQLLTVVDSFDAEGNRVRVDRDSSSGAPSGVLTIRWTYDAANRPITETAPDNAADSMFYDLAGNVVRLSNRRRLSTGMVYDRLNRLVRRVTPEVRYDSVSRGLYSFQDQLMPYPLFPNNADSGLTIFADTAVFAYDTAGNLIRADNKDARVRRTYYTDGQLRLDSLSIRYVNSDSLHNYGLEYGYDLNGRTAWIRHPSQLAVGTGVVDTAYYGYDSVSGGLTSIKDLMHNQFTLTYNNRDELVGQQMPGSVYETLGFDVDGRLTLDSIYNANTSGTDHFPQSVIRYTRLTYRDPMRVDSVANKAGWADTTNSGYSGLGHLVRLTTRRPYAALPQGSVNTQASTETRTTDPLGNLRSSGFSTNIQVSGWLGSGLSYTYTPAPVTNTYDALGRLSLVDYGAPTERLDSLAYTAAGDLDFRFTIGLGVGEVSRIENRAYYYDAAGRVRAEEYRDADAHWGDMHHSTESSTWELVFEEYRYDALGRRVLRHARRICSVTGSEYYLWPCGLDEVTRIVWAGSQQVWEMRMPDRDGYAEQDTATVNESDADISAGRFDPNPWFGRVGYTPGPGLDRPFSITRLGYRHHPFGYNSATVAPFTVVPHWNWRGEADYGLFADGRYRMCWDSTTWQRPCVRTGWRNRAFGAQQAAAVRVDLYWGVSMVWLGSLVEDQENATGSLYHRYRNIDPQTGQFTQEDPIGLAGGLNLYGFASGDPVNYTDPFGLCTDANGKELPPSQCRDVTLNEAHDMVATAKQQDWKYASYQKRDVDRHVGDCTDAVEEWEEAGATPGPKATAYENPNPAKNTGFSVNTNYRAVTASETARPGDVFVYYGGHHAGVATGAYRTVQGHVQWQVWQNGVSDTGQDWVERSDARVYRRQVPQ